MFGAAYFWQVHPLTEVFVLVQSRVCIGTTGLLLLLVLKEQLGAFGLLGLPCAARGWRAGVCWPAGLRPSTIKSAAPALQLCLGADPLHDLLCGGASYRRCARGLRGNDGIQMRIAAAGGRRLQCAAMCFASHPVRLWQVYEIAQSVPKAKEQVADVCAAPTPPPPT